MRKIRKLVLLNTDCADRPDPQNPHDPSIRILVSAIRLGKAEVEKIQRYENAVYRTILGATRGVAVAGFRGEIGASSFETRNIRSKLTFIYDAVRNIRCDLIRAVVDGRRENKEDYSTKDIEEMMERVGVTWGCMMREKKIFIMEKMVKVHFTDTL